MAGYGGKIEGSGRKPKATELELIEKLTPMEDTAIKLLFDLLKKGNKDALKLYFSYRYGLPKQTIDQKNTHEFVDIDITKLVAFDTPKS
jgi:hypothetical protein